MNKIISIQEKIQKVKELAESRGENVDEFGVVKLMQYFAEIDGLKWRPIEEEDTVIELKEWLQNVSDRYFADYDGHGEYATKTEVSNIAVCPSDITDGIEKFKRGVFDISKDELKIPSWATHVVWYNR
jgi:hypothetical protein